MPAGAAGGRGSGLSLPAVILAAGAGSRFGAEPKLLADLDGRPLVAHVVAAARAAASVARVVVVVGAHGEAVRRCVEADVVVCPEWADGQSASLRCGLAAAGDADAVLVLVGDQPGVTAAAIDRVAAAGPGARAAYDGRPGHPALLGREHVAAAGALRGDRGLRDVAWRLVECADVAHGADVDTPADLTELQGRAGGR